MKKVITALIVLGLIVSHGTLFADTGGLDLEMDEFRDEIEESSDAELQQAENTTESITEDAELGRTVTDINGYRVRVEKYCSRPASNQIKTTVLNTREDIGRIDQSVWTGTFNKDLPLRLRGIPRTMWGSTLRRLGKPEYYLTNVQRTDSCGNNTIKTIQDDGWLFHADHIVHNYYVVIFNDEKIAVNDIDKIRHNRENTDPATNHAGLRRHYYPDATGALTRVTLSNLEIIPSLEVERGGGTEHYKREKLTFADGTFLKVSKYRIDDDGNILPRGIPSIFGNLEVVFEATEFNGETIDIVITPEAGEEVSLETE
ncbi:MAG: hypothetical protein ABIH89_07305 [Elusimicrobiota bacterium]